MKLELHDAPVSQKWIEDNVTGQGKHLRTALDVLSDEGYITRTKDGKGYRIESVRPYREAEDPAELDPDETSSATSSRARPEAHVNPHSRPRLLVPL